jgi:hypothetical protein
MVTSTFEHRRNARDLRIGNKHLKQFRASNTWEISLATLKITINV